MLGKRKRETRILHRSEETPSLDINAQEKHRHLFRQYLESQFEPLPEASKNLGGGSQNEDEFDTSSNADSLSDWEGLSDEGSVHRIEIIEHREKQESTQPADDEQHAKAFMSAKPPVPGNSRLPKHQRQEQPSKEENAVEAINLKHDLELQRLLKESHLLERSSGSTLSHTHRHKAIDLRMQSLGAKSSLFTQVKMPLSHHRGIIAKAKQREASRRKEAKENGIVLEKKSKEGSAKNVRRERGVGGPAIGKFKDGTLKLSRRDVSDIQGPQKGQGTARKRRR